MVIQTYLATLRGAGLADGLKPSHFRGDASLLIRGVLHRQGTAIPHHPKLWAHSVLTEKRQGLLGLVVQGRRKPPTRELDTMLLQGDEFGVPLRDMLRPVIIDELLETEFRQHLRPCLRAALLRIKRDDAPSGQVIPSEQRLLGRPGRNQPDNQQKGREDGFQE